MVSKSHHPATSRNFSVAFERMCNFVAIAQSKDSQETRRELVLQCFAILPDEDLRTAQQIVKTIDTLFGLQFQVSDIESDLDYFLENQALSQIGSSNYVLSIKKSGRNTKTH